MYFITFNPELVLVLIRNLTAYVEAAESERYKICSSSADALDPVPSVEEATHIVRSLCSHDRRRVAIRNPVRRRNLRP